MHSLNYSHTPHARARARACVLRWPPLHLGSADNFAKWYFILILCSDTMVPKNNSCTFVIICHRRISANITIKYPINIFVAKSFFWRDLRMFILSFSLLLSPNYLLKNLISLTIQSLINFDYFRNLNTRLSGWAAIFLNLTTNFREYQKENSIVSRRVITEVRRQSRGTKKWSRCQWWR